MKMMFQRSSSFLLPVFISSLLFPIKNSKIFVATLSSSYIRYKTLRRSSSINYYSTLPAWTHRSTPIAASFSFSNLSVLPLSPQQHRQQQRQRQQRYSISTTRKLATSDSSRTSSNSDKDMSTPTTIISSYTPKYGLPGNPSWQQSMIRIRDPQKSLHFYCTALNMTHLDTFHFPQYQFSIYFVTTLPPDCLPYTLTPGTSEAHDFLWNYHGTTIELTHNHGTETQVATGNDDNDKNSFRGYHPGNQEKDGFGHLAIAVDDVDATCHTLEHQYHCTFAKKPNEGRMKGLAFVHDPDRYWIEILSRGPKLQKSSSLDDTVDCNFCQTMLRIKDPKQSIPFYLSFGMKLLHIRHFDTFSLFFLGSGNIVNDDDEDNIKNRFHPVLELTHNHGTELDPNFRHYNGNEADRPGFGHLGFLVDDVYDFCRDFQTHFPECGFRKEPDAGSMKGLAFIYDPDGYSIEIIKRGGIDFGDKKIV